MSWDTKGWESLVKLINIKYSFKKSFSFESQDYLDRLYNFPIDKIFFNFIFNYRFDPARYRLNKFFKIRRFHIFLYSFNNVTSLEQATSSFKMKFHLEITFHSYGKLFYIQITIIAINELFSLSAFNYRLQLQCIPIPGLGFRRGSYRCICKRGFYYPDTKSTSRYYDGTVIEEEYENLMTVCR